MISDLTTAFEWLTESVVAVVISSGLFWMSAYQTSSARLRPSAFGEIASGLRPTEPIAGARPLKLRFTNCSSHANLSVSWVDTGSTLRNPRELLLGDSHVEQTFEGHSFAVSGANRSEAVACYRIIRVRPFESSSSPRTVLVVDGPDSGSFSLTCAPGDVTDEDELLGALVLLDENRDGDLPLLKRYLAAVADHPDDPKYRMLKLSNAHFQRAGGCSLGGQHLLSTLGFEPSQASSHNESNSGSSSSTSGPANTGEALMMPRPSARVLVLIRQALQFLDDLQSHRTAEALAVSPDHASVAQLAPSVTPTAAAAASSSQLKEPPWHRLRRGVGSSAEGSGSSDAWVHGGHWVSHEDHFNRAARSRSMPPPPPPGRRRNGRR